MVDIGSINIESIVERVMQEMQTGTNQGAAKQGGSQLRTQTQSQPQHRQTGGGFNNTLPKTCRVAMLTGLKRIEIKHFPIPEINEDEILVKVEGCGICGTDAHEYKGDPFGLIPVVLGHEGTGIIVAIGENIKKDSAGIPVAIGDRVVTCVTAADDITVNMTDPRNTNLADEASVYGLLPDDEYHLNGWFAEYIVLRKGSVFFQVNDMSLYQRILIEPAAVVVHAVERAKSTGILRFNSNVVIQGCGPIGLMLMAVVRTLGVNNIIALDGDDNRLAFAKKLGAKKVINVKSIGSTDRLADEVASACGGRLADFGFQCTGVPAAHATIWRLIRRGGGLCELGFFVDNGDATINPHKDICQKEMTVVGSWTYEARDYPTTFDFLKRAVDIGLPIEEFITHTFPLERLTEAFDANIGLSGIKVAVLL